MSGGISVTSRSRPAHRAPPIERASSCGVIASGVAAVAALVVLCAGLRRHDDGSGPAHRAGARPRQSGSGTAKQVSDFLVGLFKVSDPSEARGQTLTAREILAKGARSARRWPPGSAAGAGPASGDDRRRSTRVLACTRKRSRCSNGRYRLSGKCSVQTARRVWPTANHLANVYWYQEKYRGGRTAVPDIVQRRTRLLGEEHLDTLRANFDLASVYAGQKRWDEFERLSRDVLAKQRQRPGAAHPDMLSSLNNLQYFYLPHGRYAEAEPLAVEVAEARRRLHGDDHPETLRPSITWRRYTRGWVATVRPRRCI